MTKEVKKGVWVLTSEHNDYDQHGEYFEAVFSDKPDIEKLAEYFSNPEVYYQCSGGPMGALRFLEHLRKGGGRVGTEDIWYNLDFVEFK